MSTAAAQRHSRSVNRLLMGTVAAIITLMLIALSWKPARAEVATLKECMDATWADYNTCLMEAGTKWGRKLCDIYFSADAALCTAKYIGEFKEGLSEGYR